MRRNPPIDFAGINLYREYTSLSHYFPKEMPHASEIELGWSKSKKATGITKAVYPPGTTLRFAKHFDVGFGTRPTKISLKMSTNLVYDESHFDSFLFHEMIHVWMFANGYPGAGHGPRFHELRKQIEKASGISIPTTHDFGKDVSPNVKPKRLGVLFYVHRDRPVALLFDLRSIEMFVARAKMMASRMDVPVSVIETTTNAHAFMPVKRSAKGKLSFNYVEGAIARSLDLLNGKKIATFTNDRK